MMDAADVARLQSKRSELRSDLIFDHICSELLQEDLINQEEYQLIKIRNTEPEKIDMLIKILPTKGQRSLDKFITILDTHYAWLAESLRNCDVQNNKEENKYQNLQTGITREMMSVVRRNHRVTKNWTGLAHTLGLSHRVHVIRSKVNTYCEEADVCILYLLEDWIGQSPKDATLAGLLHALREEHHNDCADELEKKFAQLES